MDHLLKVCLSVTEIAASDRDCLGNTNEIAEKRSMDKASLTYFAQ